MSKADKIGRLVLASVGLDECGIGILADAAQRMRGERGPEWSKLIKSVISTGLKPIPQAIAIAILSAVLGTVAVAATTEKFVAVEKFLVNPSAKAEVKIGYLGKDFPNWFLGKVEEPFAGSNLRYQESEKKLWDLSIITELGGEGKSEVTLIEMHSLMKEQGHGQDGVLLTSGSENIFYVRDINSVLRAVCVLWDHKGWYLEAYSFANLFAWGAGSRVFSRNSITM